MLLRPLLDGSVLIFSTGSFMLNLALKKAAYFWLPPFHEGKGQPSKAETVARVIWAIQFIVLIGAAIGCLFIARLRNCETTFRPPDPSDFKMTPI
ncbi:hypothetical protein NMYAN_50187 [Nitrosomonas nitrosa]|uniref:Uncharacterized protein n=1 Tax=Nitrosomonas nitrosa TaxID=52442 RepID=A0A8H8Z3C6_9PROT|nr:hypothetical protein NMYAN_50187 [Nitrosomonas nitrosa]